MNIDKASVVRGGKFDRDFSSFVFEPQTEQLFLAVCYLVAV